MLKFKRGVLFIFGYGAKIGNWISTISGRLVLWINNVDFAGGVKFYGLPYVRTASSAKVFVGKSCTFRSSTTSNLIGINRRCILFADKDAELIIGDKSGFSGTVIGCFKSIKIGSNVRCGANTLITDGDWHSGDSRVGPPKQVEIGDNVWLGVNVTVLKGVKIGENSIIGAGSVVVSDIPANTIAAGIPCKAIRGL